MATLCSCLLALAPIGGTPLTLNGRTSLTRDDWGRGRRERVEGERERERERERCRVEKSQFCIDLLQQCKVHVGRSTMITSLIYPNLTLPVKQVKRLPHNVTPELRTYEAVLTKSKVKLL